MNDMMKTGIKTKNTAPLALLVTAILSVCLICAGCSLGQTAESVHAREIHVSPIGDDAHGSGSEDHPYATVQKAVSRITPGTAVIIHKGEYDPFTLDEDASGTKDAPVTICAAPGEKAVIKAGPPAGTDEDICGILMENISFITIKGLEITGGTHGIAYYSGGQESSPARKSFEDISIRDCMVRQIRGTHGICIYGGSPDAPVTGLELTGNEVCDCECGSSETIALNGNIDGFKISDNIVHGSNNIGIDMIGFEGTAKDEASDDPFASDFVRNGICSGNTVCDISTEGNAAYMTDSGYDLCAGGIYVDGGRDIVISGNDVRRCDIGIEVATEHGPADTPHAKASGVKVLCNRISRCSTAGIALGGYSAGMGYTEDCEFKGNILFYNETQLLLQKNRDNVIKNNLFIGGSPGYIP